MTIITTDNQELTILQLGKLIKHIDKDGEEDWVAEPCNLILCEDKKGNKLELEITAVKYWCKPFTFLSDNTTEVETEQEEPIKTNPLSVSWTLDSLLTYCSTKTGITSEKLCSRTKNRTVTAVRGLYCYLAYKLTDSSLANIGEKVGIAHNMAMYYRDTVQGYIESRDKQTLFLLEQLNFKITAANNQRANKEGQDYLLTFFVT